MDAPDAVVNNNMAAVLDVPGFNYRPFKYIESQKKLPQGIILGSETASTISSRGVYKFPVERRSMPKYPDHQSSSYDVEHCGWSNLLRTTLSSTTTWPTAWASLSGPDSTTWVSPPPTTPIGPATRRSSASSTGRIPKDRYYLYRSHWNPEAETLHILPHWNWEGREGEITPIFVYTNYPHGPNSSSRQEPGQRTKDLSVTVHTAATRSRPPSSRRQQRYRLMWMDTRYEPGHRQGGGLRRAG